MRTLRKYGRWSRGEDRLMMMLYPKKGGSKLLREKLKHRTAGSIWYRAFSLGLSSPFRIPKQKLCIIRKRYPEEGSSLSLQKELGLTQKQITTAADYYKIKVKYKKFWKNRGGKNHKNYKGYEEISSTYFNRLRLGAARRGLTFNIPIEYIWGIYKKQKNICALSGIPIFFTEKYYLQHEKTASLDRIDSRFGYIKGNVQWVHKDINRMKHDFSEKIFLEYCRSVVKHHSSKK